MEAKEAFSLAPHDRQTDLWQRLMAHFSARIGALHIQLEGAATAPEATAAIRGEIRAYRALLRLNNEPHRSG